MRARELQSYLRSLNGGWMNLEKSVDTFKAGDPESEVCGIAVGWMSYTWALEEAVQLGCNVFITHEPTYYAHRDDDADVFRFQEVRAKRQYIVEHELVVLRCHDLWDEVPGIGILDSWAALLGLGNAIDGAGYFRVYDVRGKRALQVTQQVAARTRPFAQEAVQLLGPADKAVTRVGIGTGAVTPFQHLLDEYGVDLAICSDDGFCFWRDGGLAIDLHIPVIIVNHAVSEEAGMIHLAKHLQERFSHIIPVHHIPQRCMYQLVRA